MVKKYRIYEYKPRPQPSKRKNIPKRLRELLWLKTFGETFHGSCQCCREQIKIIDYEAGHKIPDSMGGPMHIENLTPLCRSCNRSMSDTPFDEFKEKYGFLTLFDKYKYGKKEDDIIDTFLDNDTMKKKSPNFL